MCELLRKKRTKISQVDKRLVVINDVIMKYRAPLDM